MTWTDTKDDFEKAPNGNHLARCVSVIDIGTHSSEFKGTPKRNRQNIITWELVNELMSDGRPFVISKYYTTGLGETYNLRKDLVNWRGRDFTPEELRGFDEKNLLGKPCQISITENEKGKTVVNAVAQPLKGVAVPEAVNANQYFSLNDDWSDEAFNNLPKWVQKKIQESEEYKFLFPNQPTPKAAAAPAAAGSFRSQLSNARSEPAPSNQLPNGKAIEPVYDDAEIPF